MSSVWERLVAWVRTDSDPEGDAPSSIGEDIAAGYRSDVLPGLLAALQSRSPHIVRAACGAVRKLGTEAAPAVPVLTAIAQAPLPKNADIQQEYARMDALHALNDILGEIERVRQREARRAEDIESAERERAAAEARRSAAVECAAAAEAEAKAARAAADARFEARRLEAANSGASDPAKPAIESSEQDWRDDEAVRAEDQGAAESTAVELLLLSTRDSDASVRAAAWESLAGCVRKVPQVLAAARSALADADPTVRRAVVRALAPS